MVNEINNIPLSQRPWGYFWSKTNYLYKTKTRIRN